MPKEKRLQNTVSWVGIWSGNHYNKSRFRIKRVGINEPKEYYPTKASRVRMERLLKKYSEYIEYTLLNNTIGIHLHWWRVVDKKLAQR